MTTNHNACFALLDDCTASEHEPCSRLYTQLSSSLTCDRVQAFPALLSALEKSLAQGLHAVGLFAYELGAQMHGIPHGACTWPLAEILLFRQCERLHASQVRDWLHAQIEERSVPAGVGHLRTKISQDDFSTAIATIRAYIEAGDTYQVNYTYRYHFDSFGSPVALYKRLRERQPVPYGALISLPDDRAVVSLSPELFLRHDNGMLTARPMKGTVAASGNASQDAELARGLSQDEKNRAENLMIVDLLRNDLGRIAKLGSVQVPSLYDVSRHGQVLQMTSTIQAALRDDVKLMDVFRAVYPCGSITGAPKRRTMEIIHEVEPDARGLYTGAIGWFDPPGLSQTASPRTAGNFCLSVPIRTLTLHAENAHGVRQGELGVGAGIVFDSVASEEYAECALKAQFLTGLPQAFQIFETMHATKAGCALLDRHFHRLRHSAEYFGFAFDEAGMRKAIQDACDDLGDGDYRMRLDLGNDGFRVQTAAIQPLQEPVRLLMASMPTDSTNLFLRHKTTVRNMYDAAWREAEARGAFDMLFCNERGELTEGGRSTLLIKLNGQWFTPPLTAGVLPGVMRGVVMTDPQWRVQERLLTPDDLCRAEALAVCNALRGVLCAVLT